MVSIGRTSLKSQLARLTDLERAQLQNLWRGLYGSDPPEQISQPLLTQAVAHPPAGEGSGRTQLLPATSAGQDGGGEGLETSDAGGLARYRHGHGFGAGLAWRDSSSDDA